MFRRRGYQNSEELREDEKAQVGRVRVQATHAKHIAGRPLVFVATASAGFLIEGQQGILIFGDSDYFPEMADIAENLDVALVPVAGWGPTLRDGHMDPQQAAEAVALLKPLLAIPIHWGTFFPFDFAG